MCEKISSIENGIDKIRELNKKAKDLQADIINVRNQMWEIWYKDRCPNHYMTFDRFVDQLVFENRIIDGPDVDSFRDECLYLSTATSEMHIKAVLSLADMYNLKNRMFVSKMICEACACQGCPHMKEHLGHTCGDCRKVGYQMYEGYCDE